MAKRNASTRKAMSNKPPKSIPTTWRGIDFRSKLEARWAVYFACLDMAWEYEPQGFEFYDGTSYLPDFVLHGMDGTHGYIGDVFVEVKPEARWSRESEHKIKLLSAHRAAYVVGNMLRKCDGWYRNMESDDAFYSFSYIDGDVFPAYLGVTHEGAPYLFGGDSNYLSDAWSEICTRAYRLAVTPRFDHGDMPDEEAIQDCASVIRDARKDAAVQVVDFNDYDIWIHDDNPKSDVLPDGEYDFIVTYFERSRVKDGRKNAGAPMAVYELCVTGNGEEREMKYFLPLIDSLRWKVTQFFKGIGAIPADTPDSSRIRYPWESVVGRCGRCKVESNTWTDKSGTEHVGNRIAYVVVGERESCQRSHAPMPKPNYNLPWDGEAEIPF